MLLLAVSLLSFVLLGTLPIHGVAAAAAFTLITFDVDGTLVKGSGKAAEASVHARAFSHAVGTVLGNGVAVKPVAEALPRPKYHGSTDGLILLRLAKAELGIESSDSFPRLQEMFDSMYGFVSAMPDEEIARGILPLPGVVDKLTTLARCKEQGVLCGLVTGNVEGIARRKMRAVGITATGALAAPPSLEQQQQDWAGANDIGFLGGFGSDFCSGNIDNDERNHLDRCEQIAIAVRRCKEYISSQINNNENENNKLSRVVHVGDAPADILAAKAYADRLEQEGNSDDLVVGVVGVATGSYPADLLRELAGEPRPGKWEPVVLQDGIADPNFLSACGVYLKKEEDEEQEQ